MKKTKVYETPELIVTKFEVSEKIMDSGSFFETTNPNEKPGDIVTREWKSFQLNFKKICLEIRRNL